MKNDNVVINVKNLEKSYSDNKVLNKISFSVKSGTMLALLGPNGAGKTTTVRILSTLLEFDGGKVSVAGYDVASQSDEVRANIGLTGQSASVDELLTGRENLIMMGRLYRLTKTSAIARADELLREFDLVKAGSRTVKSYSGGMRRRLDLAVSLIATPPIIFLDEPTTGLDPRSRMAMWDIIRSLMKKGTTILLTTQYLEEADQLADNIIMINNGKIIAEGTPAELKRKLGKDRLDLKLKNLKQVKDAKNILGNKIVSADYESGQISLEINDVNKDVGFVLDKLAKENIRLSLMEVHKPTLDDVFLSLTDKDNTKVKAKAPKGIKK
ncbi:ATP-binding cassette domain-containing protein [Candidatus Saccharibacteria bacterium]|nr:ATP-binding cassette domain-containing protein [Candidatus Saccharibacteria bacterium]